LGNAAAPWPALVKHIRFLSRLKQADLARKLGVDKRSVSRWERGLNVPDFPTQKRLRDMLRSLEPVINRSFIEHAPGNMGIGRIVSVGFVAAASETAAALFGRTPAEMRDQWTYDLMLEDEGGLAFMELIDSTPGWRQGEIATFSVTVQLLDGSCARFIGTPIGGTGLYMCIGGAVPRPKEFTFKDFACTLQPYDELCN